MIQQEMGQGVRSRVPESKNMQKRDRGPDPPEPENRM